MSQGDTSHRHQAAYTASELLQMMTSQTKTPQPSESDSKASETSHHTLSPKMSPLTNQGDNSQTIPQVSLGPVRAEQQLKTPVIRHSSQLDAPNDLETLRKEMDTQEKIIVTLQRDNEALLRGKKDVSARFKELETKYEHLEAKHSLLLSAQQEIGTRSSFRVTNDAAKIAMLQAQIQDLQNALESEKLKYATLSAESGSIVQGKEDILPSRMSLIGVNSTDNRKPEIPVESSSTAEGSDYVARLREYERIHGIHKATIDTLHAEVGRLESEKKELENIQRVYADKVNELTKRTHVLESTVARKRESIGELLQTCQDRTGSMQRLKKQESRIESLEAALVEKDEFTQKIVERLRSETKEVCKRYQSTVAALEKQIETLSKDNADLHHRLTTLGNENAELRCAAVSKDATPTDAAHFKLPTAERDSAQTRGLEPDVVEGGRSDNAMTEVNADLLHLEARLNESVAEAAKYKEISSKLQMELANIRMEWDSRLREVKRGFASQLQQLREHHNGELDRLEAGHRSELLALSKQKRGDNIDGFSAELIRIIEKKGYDASLVAICERLNYLEKRHLQKEEEMAYELSEMKRMCEIEKRIHKEKADLQIEQKNVQIRKFRLQLDELLAALAVLQATT